MSKTIDIRRRPQISKYDAVVLSTEKLRELRGLLVMQRAQIDDTIQTIDAHLGQEPLDESEL